MTEQALMKHTQHFLEKTAMQLGGSKKKWLNIFLGWRLLILLMMFISQATVLQEGQWTQYIYFRTVVELGDYGYFPLINHWIEYPPLFPWLSVGLYQLASLFTTGPLKFALFYGLLGLVFVLSECGILVLLYKIARTIYNEQKAMMVSLIFALTALPTYIVYGWFDSIAALFLIWGLERLLNSRPFQSALVAALGGMTKLFPLLLIVVGFRILPPIKQKVSCYFIGYHYSNDDFISKRF